MGYVTVNPIEGPEGQPDNPQAPDALASQDPQGGPLEGIRVIDAASLYAGPIVGTLFGDYGAEVIKVEHPGTGDTARSYGWEYEGESVWWTFLGRNKRSVTIKLSDPRGADLMRRLVRTADVLVENFRPGTLERWGLDPVDLIKENPKLVVVRTTGFGQTGPYSHRPGFGTLAEAMSGFAHTNGFEDGPPVLPQWPLADGTAGLIGAFGAMVALRHAERTGRGQIVDVSLCEPLFWILGPQTTAYDKLGHVPGRVGNHAPNTVPRNCFQSRDGRWLALSGNAPSIARRIMRAVDRPDLAEQEWFSTIVGRREHIEEIDEAISSWVGQHDSAEVLRVFEEAEAAIAPVMSIADLVADPHYRAREAVRVVQHPEWDDTLMQGIIPRLVDTPGDIRWTGPRLGQHNTEILVEELGCSPEEIEQLRADQIVRPGDE